MSDDPERGDPPRRVRRSGTTRALIAFVAVSGVLLVIDVVLNHAGRAELVGTNASATLFSYAVIALVGQSQYAYAYRAIPEARSGWDRPSASGLDGVEQSWYVRVENVGRGAGTVTSLSFEVDVPGEAPQTLRSVAALKAMLKDLKEGHDYYLRNVTLGSPLAPNRSDLFFECRPAVVERFQMLTAVMEFETAMRDVWEKRISLLPHEGATPPA